MGFVNRVMDFFGLQETREEVEEEVREDSVESFSTRKQKTNVVNLHTQKSVRVCLSEPRSYEDAQEIADNLRAHRAVVVNLQRVPRDQALRMVDFLGGTIYALEGRMQKLGPSIFFLAPQNVEVQGSISDTFLEVME